MAGNHRLEGPGSDVARTNGPNANRTNLTEQPAREVP